LVPGGGVEPPRSQGSADFESAASASSAIPAENRLQQPPFAAMRDYKTEPQSQAEATFSIA
jgi:hypothetical protein